MNTFKQSYDYMFINVYIIINSLSSSEGEELDIKISPVVQEEKMLKFRNVFFQMCYLPSKKGAVLN